MQRDAVPMRRGMRKPERRVSEDRKSARVAPAGQILRRCAELAQAGTDFFHGRRLRGGIGGAAGCVRLVIDRMTAESARKAG
jgi:hypothetical protein